MMNQLSMWQMVVDLCLVTSILVLALRAMRAPRASSMLPQTLELEKSLRKLISEAEVAGRHLNEQLLRREQNIHKYLDDVEKYEKGLSLSIVEAESLTKDLTALCASAKERAARLNDSPLVERVEKEFEPERPATLRDHFSTKRSAPRASSWLEEEREEPSPQTQARSTAQALKELYLRAETMLKEGRELHEVAERTKLPADGVQRLAQMIEIERDEESERRQAKQKFRPSDPRLGALGMSRRQTSSM